MDEHAAGHWSRLRERGSSLGLRFTVACYRTLGHWLTQPLIHAVVAYFFLTDRAGRAASRHYLERVHARISRGGDPGWKPSGWTSFRHYREFAVAITDRVAMWGGREDRFVFEFPERERFDRVAGRGAILLGAHLGSFDALRVLSHRDRAPVNVLMYTQHASKINQVLRALSPDAALRVISPGRSSGATVLEIKSCIERGEHVAILADRTEAADRRRVDRVEFLGEPVALPRAPFLLPALLGCPAVLMLALRTGPRRYEVIAEPLAIDGGDGASGDRLGRAAKLQQAFVERLEHHCERAPLQWFNFYDFWSVGE